MILIDCPAGDHSLLVELPLAATLRCDDCSVDWLLVEPEPTEVRVAA